AGMSGGIAYVLDSEGDFESRCNMAMVELEEVTGSLGNALGHIKENMTGHDAERLHRLLENHARYTNSQQAKDILTDWENYQSKFRKVMPTEFQRALNELASEQAQEQATAGE
ncbi:MAG: hypothetical protein VXY46_02250, partial [Pseudomonadota bacterium]|nr:hypothetical protein [Pseudomonadota bacterium]